MAKSLRGQDGIQERLRRVALAIGSEGRPQTFENRSAILIGAVPNREWLFGRVPHRNQIIRYGGVSSVRKAIIPHRSKSLEVTLRLTISTRMLDIETAWTLNLLLTKLSSCRKCSKRRRLGHSAQATLRPRIGDLCNSKICLCLAS